MLRSLSHRLLTLLQLTRMALVFTAIADSLCTVLLAARKAAGPGGSLGAQLHGDRMLAVAAVSVGLYGFGMTLNDIIDRRRDTQIAAYRPLPSGRVGVFTAHLICAALIALALVAGTYYCAAVGDYMSLVLLVGTGMLIAFYDLAGKYLVAPGLLTLGLIRFFQALIPAPGMPVLWHPLLLLNHVAILSAIAYQWEEKRPPLTRMHWRVVLGGLAVVDLLALVVVAARREPGVSLMSALAIRPQLVFPALAVVGFALIAWRIRQSSPAPREAGQKVMLYGLLWLIVYDACFVAAYVNEGAALLLLLLFPLAYLSVRLMRWWSKLLTLSQRPTFKRART